MHIQSIKIHISYRVNGYRNVEVLGPVVLLESVDVVPDLGSSGEMGVRLEAHDIRVNKQ